MNSKQLEVGKPVVTSDGHLLGRVAAIGADCFKVDKPMAVDQWLGFDVISDVDRDVRLSLSHEALEGKPQGIEHFGFHVHHEN